MTRNMNDCKWKMKEIHKRTLIGNRLELARSLCLEEILQFLVAKAIISDEVAERIESKRTRFSRNVALLSLIPTRGPKAYEVFIQGLRESQQCHLADMLESYKSQLINTFQAASKKCKTDLEILHTERQSQQSINNYNVNTDLKLVEKDAHDGPIGRLFVENTTIEFYQQTKHESYKMTSRPRGSALIVCVSRFKSELGISDRLGSDMDRKNLTSLLNQLEFSIVHVDNCTADEMQSAVKEFSKKDKLHDADCVVVILLSHGKGNFLYGSDGGKVRVDTLVQNFDNAHCPALRNKPKIFLIQGCRDDEIASNIAHVVTDGPPLSQDCCEAIDHSLSEANDRRRLPTCSDVVIGFSALPGHTATRNTVHGSWYIQALVRIISKHAKDKDFAEMLTLVNGFLRSKSLEQEVQSDWHETPEFRSSLCKKLYFYPGIFAKSSFRE